MVRSTLGWQNERTRKVMQAGMTLVLACIEGGVCTICRVVLFARCQAPYTTRGFKALAMPQPQSGGTHGAWAVVVSLKA